MGGEKKISKRKDNTYFLGKTYESKSDVDHIKLCTSLIEQNLEALGFTVRVVEVNRLDDFYEYYIEVAVGTDLQKLEKHDRALALALASPTGKVYRQIPVPGTNYIGLKVPRIPSKLPKIKSILDEKDPIKRNLRMKAASIFYAMGKFNFTIAQRIIGAK